MKDISRLLIRGNETIKSVMKRLDETAQKNLYVVDEGSRLVGAISDGDIRRGILKGLDLNNQASLIMNQNPRSIRKAEVGQKKKIETLMVNSHLETLPVLDEQGRVVEVIFWANIFKKKVGKVYSEKDTHVFMLAGGFGTRLEPFTKVLPKPLIPIGENPILEIIMDKFSGFGFKSFIISLNYKGDMVKAYLGDPEISKKYNSIRFLKESFPMGTIGSLSLAKSDIKESFFITNCDIIVEEDMEKIYDYHKEKGNVLTIVGCMKNSVIPYGVLKMDDTGNLVEIEEKPEYSHIINTGVYVAEPEILSYVTEDERKDITEVIGDLLGAGKKIGVYPVLDSQWFDIGQWAEYEETKKHFEK